MKSVVIYLVQFLYLFFHIIIYFNIFFIIVQLFYKNIKLFRLNFIFIFLFNVQIYNSESKNFFQIINLL